MINKSQFKSLVAIHTKIIASLLKLASSDFDWQIWSEFKLKNPNIEDMISPGVMIKPFEILDVDKPLIIINDEMLTEPFQVITVLSHELRHVWQYYENKQKWNRQLALRPIELGRKKDEPLSSSFVTKHMELEIEQDAYAFQLAYLRMVLRNDKIKMESSFDEHVDNSFYENVNKIYRTYIAQFNKTIKKLGLTFV